LVLRSSFFVLFLFILDDRRIASDPKQRTPGPKEIIKLYDTIIQNVNEMSELRDSEDEEYHKSIAAKLLTFKAFRFAPFSSPRR
jgi:hypothetical protein